RAMTRLAEMLRLEYAQFLELDVFTRFGAMVDERTQRVIEHGRRIRAILAQREFEPRPLAQQVALLLAVSEGKLDALPLELVEQMKTSLGAWLEQRCPAVLARIEASGDLPDADRGDLLAAFDAFLAEIEPSPEGRR
ncbi:MAG: F0F1 ATP synthase subunit alpha, partial [Gammaproteobacteria bacterium]